MKGKEFHRQDWNGQSPAPPLAGRGKGTVLCPDGIKR